MSQSNSSERSAIDILFEFSVPLISGVIAALIWANVDEHSYHAMLHWSPLGADSHLNFHFLINDIFMVLFFGIATKEITEACLPGGSLNPPSRAINPLLGTIGGVLGPVGFYFLWLAITGDDSASRGWGIPTATDIALAWLVARMAFGASHPAVSFLLLLAVVDDGIGLGIIAIFYPDPTNPVRPIYLLMVAAAIGFALVIRKRGVQTFWAYIMGPGILSWAGLSMAHLHPALALVPIVPFIPSMGYDSGMFAEESDLTPHDDELNRFEHFFKKPVDIGLLGFGLANAGVPLSTVGNPTWAVLFALILGKSIGIFSFSSIGHALGFKLPDGMNFRSLFVAGLTAGLGLTVALFVAGVAFTDPSLQGAAKMGALFSVVVIPLVLITAKIMRVRE